MCQMLFHGGKIHACLELSLLSCGLDGTEGRLFLTYMIPLSDSLTSSQPGSVLYNLHK